MGSINRDALLNEYKGYLFEFLVASALSRNYQLEALEKKLSEGDFNMLSQQEAFVRNQYPELLHKLPQIADQTARKIKDSFKDFGALSVSLQGKQNNSVKMDFAETDIYLEGSSQSKFISLKLAKAGLPINTKSSGIRSFFSKYLSKDEWQKELDEFIDVNFDVLARDIHQVYGVDYAPQFTNWGDLPKLPGELVSEAKEILHQYYEKVAGFIYQRLALASKEEGFVSKLYPLMGFSNKEITQVVALYENDYLLKEVLIKEFSSFTLQSIGHRKSTIIIKFDVLELHLRVKPMNTFTAKSYKLNAAVKY